MKTLRGPIKGLHFMRHNNVVLDKTYGCIHFPHLTMQVKSAARETTAKPRPVFTDDTLTIPPMITETITAFVNHPSEWNTTGTVTPLEMFPEAASRLIFNSMSTIIGKKVAARVTKTIESTYLIKRNAENAEISIVILEQTTFINPVDMATLNMIQEGDLDLTTYLNEVLETNKTEHQNSIFWFPTLKSRV